MRIFVAVICAVLILSGCAQMVWINPNKNENGFYSDKYECEMQSARAFPVAMTSTITRSGYQTATMTNCSGDGNGNASCMTSPGQYIPPVTSTFDSNEWNRKEAFKSCMESNGWRLQKKQDSNGNSTSLQQPQQAVSTGNVTRSAGQTAPIPACVTAWNELDYSNQIDNLKKLIQNDCSVMYRHGWLQGNGNVNLSACEGPWNNLAHSGKLDNARTLVTLNCPILQTLRRK